MTRSDKAGNGTRGFSGDGGSATSAQLDGITGIAVNSRGDLLIAETLHHRIRQVSQNGIIATVAGSETLGAAGDGGEAVDALLNYPVGIAVDSSGTWYIADALNSSIRKVTSGIITTIAGNNGDGYSGDGGPATAAQIGAPYRIAVDPAGNVYFVDDTYHTVRVLRPKQVSIGVSSVTNGASNLASAVAAGEIVVIYGVGLGPSQLAQYHVSGSGLVECQLAGTTVLVNGVCAPIIYTSATQVAAIVPYATNLSTAQVAVAYQGETSVAVSVPVAPAAPGLFTLDSSGNGPGACVNQDGSINTTSTPAKIGDVISCYATGEGQTTPTGVDGKPASTPLPRPVLPVTVIVGGKTVTPQYAGGAPGEVAGVMQINLQIPSGIQTGNAVPLVVQFGTAPSQSGVTIAVR